jgi:hypothetical protein
MTRKEIKKRTRKLEENIKKYYAKENAGGVQARLAKVGIKVSIGRIRDVASELGVNYRDPQNVEFLRASIRQMYSEKGPRAVVEHLKDKHGVSVTSERVQHVASDMGIKYQNKYPAKNTIVKDPSKTVVTLRNWWTFWPSEKAEEWKAELLQDWRSDYRMAGQTNLDLFENKWKARGCPSEDGIKYAAMALGEIRNRVQIAVAPKDVWNITGLEARCRQLIQEGWEARDNGIQHVVEVINSEFADKLIGGLKFTGQDLERRIDKFIWTQTVVREVKRAIRHRLPLDEFREQYFPYITEKRWKKKIKFFKGLSDANITAGFVAGVGRLITEELGSDAERFELPVNDYYHPVEISAEGDWTIPIFNAAHIGIVYDPNIEDNPLRRAASDSRKRSAAAVVVTNLINLYVKKTAGVGHIYRAAVSGLHIKLEHLPESYRPEASRVMREHPDDDVVYQSIASRFIGVLDALYKIFHRPPQDSPEYPGRVLYVLGYLEEELINEAANAELRYIRILKQNKLMTEIHVNNRLLADAEKDEDWTEVSKREKRQKELSEQLAMTILTNVSDEDRNRQRRRIRALFVKKVQESIPNCTVISQGSAYLKIGGRTVKIHMPSKVEVTDQYLASYGYGFEVFTDTLADITVVCPAYSLNHRFVGRDDSKDGQSVTKYIHVAPMLVDDLFLRDQLKDTTRELHPIQRCVNNPQFRPGVLVINSTNGLLSADPLPIAKLDRSPAKKFSLNFAYPYPETKYITLFLNTDNHFGAPDKRYIWDSKGRVHLGTTEALMEMIRREGIVNPNDIPIHGIDEMDDATNGDMWFSPRYRQDPQEMIVIHFERWLRQLTADIQRASERGDTESVRNMTEELNRISIAQLYFQGEDFPFHQMMQVFDRHIDPNVDFYSAVLGRFVKSGLEIRGISKINRTMSDTRDLGVHNFPNGNHRIKTLDQKDLEGDYIARHLQEKLAQLPEWQKYLKNHPNFLRETVRAPRFGNQTFGWGTIKAPGGFEWGLMVHGSPARQSSWNDILAALIKSDLDRGDDTYGLRKFVTVVLLGDKHFYAKAETARTFYVMCAAGVHTNQYGSVGGFPPNNTGPCFVSIPADGPDAGPVIVKPMPHDVLRDWFANPKPFNFRKYVPKPV